ncbi:hypothetical protein [Streptosporangium sp. NPDC000396]|uniref:hypothetical protein n=1 Tax=Streptosporangium sp. NPDC000396 TaxID=3366185 RepID=UPI003680050D
MDMRREVGDTGVTGRSRKAAARHTHAGAYRRFRGEPPRDSQEKLGAILGIHRNCVKKLF